MAWTGYQTFLCLLMILTGTINSLSTKWADVLKSVGRDQLYPRKFNHPFFQVFCMFTGEVTCLLAFKILLRYYRYKDYTPDQLPPSVAGNRNFNPLVFLIPAICDFTSTSLMYIGIILTDVSSFQMLRGSLIIFTCLLSVGFLGKKVKNYEIVGIVFAISGLVTVGISDLLRGSKSEFGPNGVITGDLLIILGQVMTATQFVVEEKFVSGKNISPLHAVGLEGSFGCIIVGLMFVPLYYIPGGDIFFTNPYGSVEDVLDAFYQIKNNKLILIAILGNMSSIAFFNFAGVSVTQQLSAPTRSVLDTIRTITIKIAAICIPIFGESLDLIQLFGFVLLAIGLDVYNDFYVRVTLVRLQKKLAGIFGGKRDDTGDDNSRVDEVAEERTETEGLMS